MRIYFDMNMSKPSLYDVFVDGIAGKKIRFLGAGGVGLTTGFGRRSIFGSTEGT